MTSFYLIHRRFVLSTQYPNWKGIEEKARIKLQVIEEGLSTLRFEAEEYGAPFKLNIPDINVEVYDDEGVIQEAINSFNFESDLFLLEIINEEANFRHLLVVREILQNIDFNHFTIRASGGADILNNLKGLDLNIPQGITSKISLTRFLSLQVLDDDLQTTKVDDIYFNLGRQEGTFAVIGFDNIEISIYKLRGILNRVISENRNSFDRLEFILFLAKILNAVIFIDNGKFYFIRRDLYDRDLGISGALDNLVVNAQIYPIYRPFYNGIITQVYLLKDTRQTEFGSVTITSSHWIAIYRDKTISILNFADVEKYRGDDSFLFLWDIDLWAMEVADFLLGFDGESYWKNLMFLIEPLKTAEVEVYGLDYKPMDRVLWQGEYWNVWSVEKDLVAETSKLLLYSVGKG